MRNLANDTRPFMPPLGLWACTGGAAHDPNVGIILANTNTSATSPWIEIPPWATRIEWYFAAAQTVPGWRNIRVYSASTETALIREPASLGLPALAIPVEAGNWIKLRIRYHPSAQIPALLHGGHIRVLP